MASVLERLGVNIASVVIGALVFIIAIAWVDAFLALTEHVIFDGGIESKQVVNKKVLAATFVSVAAGVIALVIYSYYAGKTFKDGKDDDEVEGEDFVAVVELFDSTDSVFDALSTDTVDVSDSGE